MEKLDTVMRLCHFKKGFSDDDYIVKGFRALPQPKTDQSKFFCNSSLFDEMPHEAESEYRNVESPYGLVDPISLCQEVKGHGENCDIDIDMKIITSSNHYSGVESKGIAFSGDKIYLKSPLQDNTFDYGENLFSITLSALDLAVRVRTPKASNRLYFVGISIDKNIDWGTRQRL